MCRNVVTDADVADATHNTEWHSELKYRAGADHAPLVLRKYNYEAVQDGMYLANVSYSMISTPLAIVCHRGNRWWVLSNDFEPFFATWQEISPRKIISICLMPKSMWNYQPHDLHGRTVTDTPDLRYSVLS